MSASYGMLTGFGPVTEESGSPSGISTPVFMVTDQKDGTGATVLLTDCESGSTNTFKSFNTATEEYSSETSITKNVSLDAALSNGTYWGIVTSTKNSETAVGLAWFKVTASGTRYIYGGVLGRDLAAVTLLESASPPSFNDVGEEEFVETYIEVSGLLDTQNVSLRRAGNQGRVEYVDAVFKTLYQLSAPYPDEITINSMRYRVTECLPIFEAAETRWHWFLMAAGDRQS